MASMHRQPHPVIYPEEDDQDYHLNAARQYDRLPPGDLDSPALGLRLPVQDGWLRLRNLATGALLPTLPEAAQTLAARGAELAEAEKTLALRDAEIARLRADLARLRGER